MYPKENPIYNYSVNQHIVVTEGKEINRDSQSSGERNETSFLVSIFYQFKEKREKKLILISWNR